MKILDLNVFQAQTWEVKMLGGETLSACKPTQALVLAMINAKERMQSGNAGASVETLTQITTDILSNNTQRRILTAQEVAEQIPIPAMAMVLSQYTEFTGELTNSKNS